MNNKQRMTGAILPLVAIAMVALFGFLALALDVGLMMWRKSQFQTAIDAAALSAAHCRFMEGMSEADAQDCGDDTFRYNLESNGLWVATAQAKTRMSEDADDPEEPETPEEPPMVYIWSDSEQYVDLEKQTMELDTLFAGAFFNMIGSNGDKEASLDTFSMKVTARAGIPEVSITDVLPLVVDWGDICTKLDENGRCGLDDLKTESVRTWALVSPFTPENDRVMAWDHKDLFHWLAGSENYGYELSLNKPYLYCKGDDCRSIGLGEDENDKYEDAIEDGLETRIECDDDDDCEVGGNLYSPDYFEGELTLEDDDDEEHDHSFTCDHLNSAPYLFYFEHTENTCAFPKNDRNVAEKQCGKNDDCQDDHDCWESDDDEGNPESYRRVIMAGIGLVNKGAKKATIEESACFVIDEVDDPGEKDEEDDREGIYLAFIPKGPQADAAGCQYSEFSGGTRQTLVLMGGGS